MITLSELEAILPRKQLEALALQYRVDAINQIRLPGPAVLVCLLHALVTHGEITQRLLEEIYWQHTGHHADHSSFGKRLGTLKPEYVEAVFHQLYQKLAPTATRGDTQALRLRFVDATTVTLSAKLLAFGLKAKGRNPNKARRAVKSVFELSSEGLPNFLHLCKEDAEASDSVAIGRILVEQSQAGDLWVFDKGCHSRDRLLEMHQQCAFWITPHGTQGVRVDQVVWEAPKESRPTEPPKPGGRTFVLVRVEQGVFQGSKPDPKWESLPLVLVHGIRYDQRKKAWVPLVLMTNLPLCEGRVGPFTFLEIAELYRRRWEIETFFKFIKQHLGYSHLLSRKENGIRVTLFVTLIASLLMLWYKAQSGIDRGWRSVKSWFAHDIQIWTEQVLRAAIRRREGAPVRAPC